MIYMLRGVCSVSLKSRAQATYPLGVWRKPINTPATMDDLSL